MSETELVPAGTPPEHVLRCRPQVYNILLNVALGATVKYACEQVALTRKTYYAWLKEYPTWMARIRLQANQDAIELYRQRAREATLAKAAAQMKLESMVLEKGEELLERILEDALHEDASGSFKLRAFEALLAQVKEGFYTPQIPLEKITEDDDREVDHFAHVNLLESAVFLADGTPLDVPDSDSTLQQASVFEHVDQKQDPRSGGQAAEDGMDLECEEDNLHTQDEENQKDG